MEIFASTVIKSGVALNPAMRYRVRRTGFTMIEMIVVIAIIGIMATLSMSIGPSILTSNRFTQNILTMSGIMEMARQHAITNNTYVWVAFTDAAPEGVYVAAIESKEGTNGLADPSSGIWENSGKKLTDAVYANLSLLRKIQLIPNLALQDSATLPVPGMPAAPTNTKSMQAINLIIPVGGKNKTFTRAVQFTPTGEAKVVANSSAVELCIAPSTSAADSNFAVLRLASITGKLTVYRPN